MQKTTSLPKYIKFIIKTSIEKVIWLGHFIYSIFICLRALNHRWHSNSKWNCWWSCKTEERGHYLQGWFWKSFWLSWIKLSRV